MNNTTDVTNMALISVGTLGITMVLSKFSRFKRVNQALAVILTSTTVMAMSRYGKVPRIRFSSDKNKQ